MTSRATRYFAIACLSATLGACAGDDLEPVAAPEPGSQAPAEEGIPNVLYDVQHGSADQAVSRFDSDLLFGGTRPGRVKIQVAQDRSYIAKRRQVQAGNGSETWLGNVDGNPDKTILFSRVGNTVVGSIRDGNDYIRIIGDSSGGTAEITAITGDDTVEGAEPPPEPASDFVPLSAAAAAEVEDDAIDVAIFYTSKARDKFGGAEGFRAAMVNEIALLNQIMSDGGVSTWFRLAGVRPAYYIQHPDDMGTDLARLRDGNDGFMDGTHNVRDDLGADIVHLVVADSTSSCGIANYNQDGDPAKSFGVSAVQCFYKYTLQHEIGHNLGFNHAPVDNGGNGGGAYSFSYGYKDATNKFRSLMAYGCDGVSCPRLPRLSNPRQTHDGHALGTTSQDNSRTVGLTWKRLSSIRPAKLQANFAATASEEDETFCSGKSVELAAVQYVGATYSWRINGIEVSADPIFQWDNPDAGDHELELLITDGSDVESASTTLSFAESASVRSTPTGMCRGEPLALEADNAVEVEWISDAPIADATSLATTAWPEESTTVTAVMTTADGCTNSESFEVAVGERPEMPLVVGPPIARTLSTETYAVETPFDVHWTVSGGEIIADHGTSIEVHWPEGEGERTVQAEAYSVEECSSAAALEVEVADMELVGGCSTSGRGSSPSWLLLLLGAALLRRRKTPAAQH